MWICIVRLSLLRTGYISLAANVLTRGPKIWYVNKRDFFEHNFVSNGQSIWQICCDPDFNSVCSRLRSCFSKGPLTRDFLEIYISTFSESVISEIQNLWRSSFDSKYLKFNLDFKNAEKNSEKVFSFWDNCIWIGIFKLFLRRTR